MSCIEFSESGGGSTSSLFETSAASVACRPNASAYIRADATWNSPIRALVPETFCIAMSTWTWQIRLTRRIPCGSMSVIYNLQKTEAGQTSQTFRSSLIPVDSRKRWNYKKVLSWNELATVSDHISLRAFCYALLLSSSTHGCRRVDKPRSLCKGIIRKIIYCNLPPRPVIKKWLIRMMFLPLCIP